MSLRNDKIVHLISDKEKKKAKTKTKNKKQF